MYRRLLPTDAFICLALSVLVATGTGQIAARAAKHAYTKEVEAPQVTSGDIGGPADKTVFQAQSVEDLLAHDTFTVVSPGIQYRNEGAGYHDGHYLYNLRLPNGERVAACVNGDSVQTTGDSLYTGDSILPIGNLVWEDFSQDEGFLGQIEHKYPLTRTDFYVDMVGDARIPDEEQALETPKMIVQVVTVLICYPLFHMLGSSLGIFPRYFSFRKKKK